jgi:aconitate hydratase 2/2-methylisocitrate dehydratase
LGHIPSVTEYHANMGILNADSSKVYQYLNFDKMPNYQ